MVQEECYCMRVLQTTVWLLQCALLRLQDALQQRVDCGCRESSAQCVLPVNCSTVLHNDVTATRQYVSHCVSWSLCGGWFVDWVGSLLKPVTDVLLTCQSWCVLCAVYIVSCSSVVLCRFWCTPRCQSVAAYHSFVSCPVSPPHPESSVNMSSVAEPIVARCDNVFLPYLPCQYKTLLATQYVMHYYAGLDDRKWLWKINWVARPRGLRFDYQNRQFKLC